MLGATCDVEGDGVAHHRRPTPHVRRLTLRGTPAVVALLVLAACGGSNSGTGSTNAPVTTPPYRPATTTTVSATSTSAAPATPDDTDGTDDTDDTATGSQYGDYTVQADLALAPTPTAQHQVLWDLFRRVLGDAATTQYIERFTVYDDPYSSVDATVLDGRTPGMRHVSVNARYADDLRALTRTFIHEYGHIVTLAGDQMISGGACGTTSLDEGCLADDSYLNGFLNRFWWVHGTEAFEALGSPTANDAFYATHQSEFVTRYAATSPVEDIAEVWAEFVIGDTPAGATVAEQKILYLYGFAELVELRAQIRERVGDVLGV